MTRTTSSNTWGGSSGPSMIRSPNLTRYTCASPFVIVLVSIFEKPVSRLTLACKCTQSQHIPVRFYFRQNSYPIKMHEYCMIINEFGRSLLCLLRLFHLMKHDPARSWFPGEQYRVRMHMQGLSKNHQHRAEPHRRLCVRTTLPRTDRYVPSATQRAPWRQ